MAHSLELQDKLVRFRIRDIYHPDAGEVSMVVHGDDFLVGTVVALSDSGDLEGAYAVVLVEAVQRPVVVPTERVSLVQ